MRFVCLVGAGASMAEAAEHARLERAEFSQLRATITGSGPALGDEVSRDGRLAADWLERYAAPVAQALMVKAWPSGTIAVDAKTFNLGSGLSGLAATGSSQRDVPRPGHVRPVIERGPEVGP